MHEHHWIVAEDAHTHATWQANAAPGQVVAALCLTQVVIHPPQDTPTPAPVCADCELALAHLDLLPLAVAV